MARPVIVYADLQLTHGGDSINIKGQGDRIEVSHSSIRFLFKVSRKTFPMKYAQFIVLDQSLRLLGLNVILKTKYFCFTILGVNARKWVKLALRFILPG